MNSLKALQLAVAGWANQDPEYDYRLDATVLLERLQVGDKSAVETAKDLFESRVTFGTAGLRGPMRVGPNGINRLVISQTTAGVARFLQEKFPAENSSSLHVVIGFDGRHHSETFARDTAEVLSGHGIRATLLPRMLPTPVLAFAVRQSGATAGVMITASHNPSRDNGYKLYFGGRDEGSQVIPPADTAIEAHIQRVALRETWATIPRSTQLVSVIDVDIVKEYLVATLDSLRLPVPTAPAPTYVYTAMHGVGGRMFIDAIAAAGFSKPQVVKEQIDPDPDFPTVAFPNPEEKGALDLSFAKGRSVGAEFIIAHDPDADRLSVTVRDDSAAGGFKSLTGNQVGAILGWHIAQGARLSGRTGTLANSVVSSPVLGKIANHFELKHDETLTGFKYISRVKNLIFGFEEALGYLVTPEVVRDKDGISAGLMMVSLAHAVASEGKTLMDYLRQIEESVGAFSSGQVTIRLNPGDAGSRITRALREREISEIGALSVTHRDDFLGGVAGFPKVDMIRYYLSNRTRIIARPSGTEAKVKIYIDTEGTTPADAELRLANAKLGIDELVSSLKP